MLLGNWKGTFKKTKEKKNEEEERKQYQEREKHWDVYT
jgi:hypothetical protein